MRRRPARVRRGCRVRPSLGPLSAPDVVAMLDHLTDGIVVVCPDWRFRYVNEPGARILGRRPDQLVGRTGHDAFPELVGVAFHLAYERAMREGAPVRIVDHYAPADRWFENRIYPR